MRRVAVTRRAVKELPTRFDDLAASALLLAELADDVLTPAAARIRAVVEWRTVMEAISTRAADDVRTELSWQTSRPRAV
jgi:hypothetical protein